MRKILFILGLSGALLAGCKEIKNPFGGNTGQPTPSGEQWVSLYSPGLPATLPRDSNGRIYFDFPSQNGAHMIVRTASLRVGQTITATFAVVGDATFRTVDGQQTPQVRFYVQRRGDNFSGDNPSGRWWSPAHVVVAPGTYTLSAHIDGNWTNVAGHPAQNDPGFQQAVESGGNVGFSFGGHSYGYAHGVYAATGTARFVLVNFTVN